MSIKVYENGVWVDKTPLIYKNGAWTAATSASVYRNGAWTEVWSNVKPIRLIGRTTTTGCFFPPEKWETETWVFAVDDSGYVELAADGNFVNPTISFAYEGGLSRTSSDGTFHNIPAGNIYTLGITASGSKQEANSLSIGTSSAYTEKTNVQFTLNGTFVKVGLKVKFTNWNISPDATGWPRASTLFLSKIMINGQKYAAVAADKYDYGDY